MRPRRPLAVSLALAAIAIVSAIATDAPAATAYQCGPGGSVDLSAKRCVCPSGKFESTDKKGISRCIDAPKTAPKTAPTSSPSAKPSATSAPPKCPRDMVATPGGAFVLAARADVSHVAPFCLDATEVTVAAYARCVDAGTCSAPDPVVTVDPAPKWRAACNWKNPGRGDHPVNCVDMLQASAYCASIGRRLPTEDEWEWAARGGDEARAYPWGNTLPSATLANTCGAECAASAKAKLGLDFTTMPGVTDAFAETAPVGSFPAGASRWGALDLGGNVAEWTSSPFAAGKTDVVVRGGAWDSYQYVSLSTNLRRGFAPTLKNAVVGFRCAKTP